MVSEGILFGIGNPLLDISAHADKDFLDKYGLDANTAILAEEKHMPMYEEMIKRFSVEYIPGGATQNSFRIAQWILDQPERTTFCGCIGDDEYAVNMRKKMAEAKVRTSYLVDREHPTGTCAAVITGKNRSLVANLAAANHYKKDHLLQPENWKLVEKAEFYYATGFHLTVSPGAMLALAEHALEHNKVFMTNLSAPFICQFFKEPQMQVMPYVDYLFGNETEFASFAREQDFGTEDLEEVALKAAALEKKNTKRSRIVVITQGCNDTIVAQDGKITKFPVKLLKEEEIVDTNGAGDAFVGGFLAQLVQGKDVAECIRCANYAANYIIQRSGISFGGKSDYQ
ncbi:adenosine kinase-like isoform X2 [Acanthaster planci]|uniref:Adenosine kinase n=1 Tax=Acanthaster planci TaxID=133434 RepID=A0A8B7Z956_ACAPL|nr:adenosine kinase-like isoform X2 [Acanthaster planci]